ncbi:zf-TFIIB domain-containing protein [Rhodoferax sp.]|uniref:zf-TFIIB domain-containing protein n=1 Tax=Rhodoferax sp. TaxID=50421 RepID=UPI002ACDAE6E|nr:zf-TFIIB domain-containing protein [Rhodoferax sp.]MDZ7920540.1 zf-TFIIB domain-containing protein [Rhodoferax sp.]
MRTPTASSAPCPACRQALHHLVLEGHYAKSVEVDLCTGCHLVWFDAFESVRLSGLGWVQLLRAMVLQPSSRAALPRSLSCVRCRDPLSAVRNQTRFGHTAALECRQGHGQLQTFTLLLAERGLLRQVLPSDRSALAQEGRALQCLQCGAGDHAPDATQCVYCQSPLLMVDVPRLASALLVRHGDALQLPPGANPLAMACRGCGQPLDPTAEVRCPRCDHALVWSDWHSVRPLLDAVEPLLRAQQPRQAKPWGTRLKEQQGDHRATQFHRWLRHANLVSARDEGGQRDLRVSLLDWRSWLRLAVLGVVFWLFFK